MRKSTASADSRNGQTSNERLRKREGQGSEMTHWMKQRGCASQIKYGTQAKVNVM